MQAKAPLLSTVEVARSVGVTYRQVDHWCRAGLVPGQEEAQGSGYSRQFTIDQFRRVQMLALASQLHSIPLGDLADLIRQGQIRVPARRRRLAS